jgi:hypothetical protein
MMNSRTATEFLGIQFLELNSVVGMYWYTGPTGGPVVLVLVLARTGTSTASSTSSTRTRARATTDQYNIVTTDHCRRV